MTTFQRARSEEQREARPPAILDTAAAMLAEMPVAEVTLNELSRRVGLAKSNVLRYFESREAVLLELLDAAWQDWLADLAKRLASAPRTDANEGEVADDDRAASTDAAVTAARAEQLAGILVGSLTDRPVLCDLLSAQSAVLERNVSPVVAATYKRAAIANVGAVARLALAHVPELGEQDAMKFAGAAVMVTGALWSSTQPSAAMLVAYESDPALAVMRLDFASTLREVLEVLIAGLLARPSA
jgi:AcrR family transcriptional regulator